MQRALPFSNRRLDRLNGLRNPSHRTSQRFDKTVHSSLLSVEGGACEAIFANHRRNILSQLRLKVDVNDANTPCQQTKTPRNPNNTMAFFNMPAKSSSKTAANNDEQRPGVWKAPSNLSLGGGSGDKDGGASATALRMNPGVTGTAIGRGFAVGQGSSGSQVRLGLSLGAPLCAGLTGAAAPAASAGAKTLNEQQSASSLEATTAASRQLRR